ncbi:MAG: ATP-binding protein [Planctomycetes bacterium]|nr:ATP-binding protein [Planctomycetota bacterium]
MTGRPGPDARTALLELPSATGMAAVARTAVRAVLASCAAQSLNGHDLDEIAVVVQEACTNAIRHAHRLDATKSFRVEVFSTQDRVEIVVSDEGAPFALSDVAPAAPELLREGGYGVHIMRTWMDEVSVTHDGSGNVLRLIRQVGVASANREGAASARSI